MKVIDIWESADAYHAFREQRLIPAISEALGPVPPKARPAPRSTSSTT